MFLYLKIVKFVTFSAFFRMCRIRQIISSSSLNTPDAHSSKDESSCVPAASSVPVSAHPAAPRPFFSTASGRPVDVPANHSEPSSHRGYLTRAPAASSHHRLTRSSNISSKSAASEGEASDLTVLQHTCTRFSPHY